MSNVFTIASLRDETERKLQPTLLELADGSTVELTSVLKLGEKDRKAVLDAISEISEIEGVVDEDDASVEEWSEIVCDSVAVVFRLIASSPRKLLAELDHGDPQVKATLYTTVLSRWLGEVGVLNG